MALESDKLGKHVTEFAVTFQQVDPLTRINLPPLLGRRDAALDEIAQRCAVDISALPEDVRRSHCEEIIRGAHQCARNSNRILSMFSSPDTRSRECRLLRYVEVINQLASSMEMLLSIPIAVSSEDIAPLTRERVWELIMPIYEELRLCFENGKTRLARYREYVANSLSAENGERYRLAYLAAKKLEKTIRNKINGIPD